MTLIGYEVTRSEVKVKLLVKKCYLLNISWPICWKWPNLVQWMPLGSRWLLLIFRSHGVRSGQTASHHTNVSAQYLLTPFLENRQNPYNGYPLRLDIPYWCSGHMVKGWSQTVGLNIKIYRWFDTSSCPIYNSCLLWHMHTKFSHGCITMRESVVYIHDLCMTLTFDLHVVAWVFKVSFSHIFYFVPTINIQSKVI